MSSLGTLIEHLPTIAKSHKTSLPTYALLKQLASIEVKELFSSADLEKRTFAPFGEIVFPYFQMGAINSLDLFGLDELIIFSFYWVNKGRYNKVLDIGSNIGLHSIILSRCGYTVTAFEPDPVHFEQLKQNLTNNHCDNVKAIQAAVSTTEGRASFVRVLGNTTSSHIEGSKQPYGELETFEVDIVDIHALLPEADLVKMDIEGHEKDLLLSTDAKDWANTDAILEIGSSENADAIFSHLQQIGLHSFAQKIGWNKVTSRKDMPESHRDGSLFISTKDEMPWGI